MWFWWLMLCCDLIIPIVLIICGRLMWKQPPKNINGFVGYRTSRSMKNMDTWNFAHNYCGKFWWKLGWIFLFPSLIAHIPFYNSTDFKIGIVCLIIVSVQFIVLIASIFKTEHVLKNSFTETGIKR